MLYLAIWCSWRCQRTQYFFFVISCFGKRCSDIPWSWILAGSQLVSRIAKIHISWSHGIETWFLGHNWSMTEKTRSTSTRLVDRMAGFWATTNQVRVGIVFHSSHITVVNHPPTFHILKNCPFSGHLSNQMKKIFTDDAVAFEEIRAKQSKQIGESQAGGVVRFDAGVCSHMKGRCVCVCKVQNR